VAGAAAGTVVPNPGGPGESTIAAAAEWRAALGSLRRDRDLLLVDVRGTGASDELDCTRAGDVFAPDTTFAVLAPLCAERLGALHAGAYGSAAAADDLDAVRAALGVERLDLWGQSYGTYLFTVYARRHPAHVRSLLLSGAYAPDFDPWARDRARALRRGFRLACRRSGRCDGRAAIAHLGRLARRLARRPLPYRANAFGRRWRLRADGAMLASLGYASAGNPDLYVRLALAARTALRGDTRPLLRLVRAAVEAISSPRAARGVFSVGTALATSCHDYPAPYDRDAPLAKRRAQYAAALRGLRAQDFAPFAPQTWSRAVVEGGDTCIHWPAPLGDGPLVDGPLPAAPVLIANGDLDANTPLSSARRLGHLFPRALVREPRLQGVPVGVAARRGGLPDAGRGRSRSRCSARGARRWRTR
jgi:pimeloyl-ACP methyl ester carboxylesterase